MKRLSNSNLILQFRLKHPTIGFSEFGDFIDSGGTRSLRHIQSKCLRIELPLSTKSLPKKNRHLQKDLQALFNQKNITFVFNSRLVQKAANCKISAKKIKHPLPWRWQPVFIESNFPVSRIASHLLWKVSNLKKAFESILKVLNQIRKIVFTTHSPYMVPEDKFLVCTSFAGGKILSRLEQDGFTFGNWLGLRPEFADKDMYIFPHEIASRNRKRLETGYSANFSESCIPVNKRPDILKDFFVLLVHGFFRTLSGKPEFLSLCHEITTTMVVDVLPLKQLPHAFFFTESDGVIRPLWTYCAERRGSKVIHLFFSNCDTPTLPEEASSNFLIYESATWQNYWCVDDFQIKELMSRTGLSHNSFNLVGHPWRGDSKLDLPQEKLSRIAIFDYEVKVGNFGFGTINDVGYFDERKDLRFLNDLVYVAQRLNVVLLHKPKRNLPIEERTPRYASLLQELINHPNYQRIDAEVSPHQLIMEADLVISVPITSTALIAKNLGKPSIYYDSIGKLDSSDPVLRNIELIQNPKDLQEKIRLILLSIAKQ
jgi:hypothetical protein